MPDVGVIVAAIVGTGGIAAVIGAWAARHKPRSEAEVTTGGEWGRIATRHEAEIATLKIELSLLRGEMNNVRAERTDLILRVSALTAARDRERETSAALRGEVDTLKKRVRELERAP